MTGTQKPFHETVAEHLIEQLKAGTAPWQRPWEPGVPGGFLPINPTTGKRYKGINAIHLMSQGHTDNRWITYKQAAAVGAQVRKGEKGTSIQYWKFSEEETKRDENGRPVLDGDGKPVKENILLERPRVFFATVFNGEQIDGLLPIERKEQAWEAVERAESILHASGAVIRHGEHNRAFYRPATDSIHLPDKGQFLTADRYYATALHELGHWTGHASRLNRDLLHPFGSEGYAKEELRAEIASMIVGDELGIGHDPSQHAAYVATWIQALKDDPLEIFRASADAEKISNYVMAFEQKQLQEQAQGQEAIMRQALQQTAPEAAESWTLGQAEHGTLVHALDTANLAQIKRVIELLDEMQPLNTQNAFWTRHELPEDVDALDASITTVIEPLHQLLNEARVAEARKVGDRGAFEVAVRVAFGLPPESLPQDWNGRIQVQSNAGQEVGSARIEAAATDPDTTPNRWSVHAQCEDGRFERVKDFDRLKEAEQLAYRLAVVVANATDNLHERAVILARAHEDRVRRDPGSTDEEKSAAKAVRKAAELNATLNDASLKKHIAEQEALRKPVTDSPVQGERTYLSVPYREKDEVKSLGARWDRKDQSWYIPPGVDPAPFARWAQGASRKASASSHNAGDSQARVYLAVPYGERAVAKAGGAIWDKAAASWYAGPNADMGRLQRWLPDNVPAQQAPAMPPQQEFADAMRSMGFLLDADPNMQHPIMDGNTHRVAVEGDKKGERAGYYVGHLDGLPAGYIKNNRTGVEMKWKSKGYSLDPQEKARLMAEAASKLVARAEEQERLHLAAAHRVSRQMAELIPVLELTPYMRNKGIQAHPGVFTDREGKTTYIPIFDDDGKQWTMQYIQADGTKRFAKDSRKEGCFHPVGGMDAVAAAPVLIIAEGYATAATLAEALGQATVAALDSGNLPAVAQALHQKFPDKPVIIAGDDDRHQIITQGTNPGRTKAEEAAKAVGGTAIFPIFAPGENAYPSNLPPITPQSYREHERALHRLEAAKNEPEKVQLTEQETTELKHALLSTSQLAALAGMKAHTDFNDLAMRSELGREGVTCQMKATVRRVVCGEAAEQRRRTPPSHERAAPACQYQGNLT